MNRIPKIVGNLPFLRVWGTLLVLAIWSSLPLAAQMETPHRVGMLLALAPKLNEAQFSEEERSALLEAFNQGFTYEESLPEDITNQFDVAREALRAQFLARSLEKEEKAIGEDMARILGFAAFDFLGVPPQAFSQEEAEAIGQGLAEGLNKEEMPAELRANFRSIFQYLDAQAEPYEVFLGELILPHERSFFKKLREDPEVEYAEDGLHWKIINPGTGQPPAGDATVLVHYIGRLPDRTIFDSSYRREEPTEFSLARVIPGFSRGLQKIGEGGRVEIYIPTRLAYNDRPPPTANIDPLDTLVFEAELLGIVDNDS